MLKTQKNDNTLVSNPIQLPDEPITTICESCGTEYTNAIVKSTNNIVSFHCPHCDAVVENEKKATIKELRQNLNENFQIPISKLNEETQKMWQNTIKYAQFGFLVRMILSIIIFFLGAILLCVSSWRIIFGQLSFEQFLGPGVSFASGLAAMFSVIYKGPLKDIRTSISDLGIASATFIAYIHQILQISHTFSFYYLNQQISFSEMKKSNDLIQEAMKVTIKALYTEGVKDLQIGSSTGRNDTELVANQATK
jgi:predicted RNA-binding Zn-ribbon protein involved in translation (DUF1610 family)